MNDTILQVKDLQTWFHIRQGTVKAVNGVSFSVKKGEILGIVGESGCGKSITALSILRLITSPPGKIEGGEILYKGRDLLKYREKDMKKIRGNEISMIFQEPMTSLNPVFKVGTQIAEAIIRHQGMSTGDAWRRTQEMIRLVGIPNPEKCIHSYPHELSGGMRQRVMIAIALACNPSILIADEPTTALDVTIQAQILKLMYELKDKTGTAIMMITHDIGVIAQLCERMVVMYCGKIVEEGMVCDVLNDPKHPYTKGLLNSIPHMDRKVEKLYNIPGAVPPPLNLPAGCRFEPRCEFKTDICKCSEPELEAVSPNRAVRCWLTREGGKNG